MDQRLLEPSYFARLRTQGLLWFAFVAGPLAWGIGLLLDYALVRVACAEGTRLPLHLVTLVTLAVAILGGWVAWREWGRAGREEPGEEGGPVARTRFMALIGLAAAAFFALVILAQWLGKLFLNPCMAI